MTRYRSFLFVLVCAVTSASVSFAGDWAGFRGPTGLGYANEKNLPKEWSRIKNVKWSYKLPGPGNSSPIVAAGKVFVTCAEERGTRRNLSCIDRQTGKELWIRTVNYDEREKMSAPNSVGVRTPD